MQLFTDECTCKKSSRRVVQSFWNEISQKSLAFLNGHTDLMWFVQLLVCRLSSLLDVNLYSYAACVWSSGDELMITFEETGSKIAECNKHKIPN